MRRATGLAPLQYQLAAHDDPNLPQPAEEARSCAANCARFHPRSGIDAQVLAPVVPRRTTVWKTRLADLAAQRGWGRLGRFSSAGGLCDHLAMDVWHLRRSAQRRSTRSSLARVGFRLRHTSSLRRPKSTAPKGQGLSCSLRRPVPRMLARAVRPCFTIRSSRQSTP